MSGDGGDGGAGEGNTDGDDATGVAGFGAADSAGFGGPAGTPGSQIDSDNADGTADGGSGFGGGWGGDHEAENMGKFGYSTASAPPGLSFSDENPGLMSALGFLSSPTGWAANQISTAATGKSIGQNVSDAMFGVPSVEADMENDAFSGTGPMGATPSSDDGDGEGGNDYRPYLLTSNPVSPVLPDPVTAPPVLTPYENLKQRWAGNQFLLAPIRRQS